ncbi:MAG: GEVED domain-containing protein [Bacteroidales bacterium]
MRKLKLFTIFLVFIFVGAYSQENDVPLKATFISKTSFMIKIPSIAAQIESGNFEPAVEMEKEVNPKNRDVNKAVPGKGLPVGPDPLWDKQMKKTKIKGKDPILTFQAASSGATPTDPTGAVGPNHFLNSWNSAFRIWDKSGNALTPAASLGTIFPGQTMGDPIVMYDAFADRFVVTEFYANGFLVAVSQGPDPVNDGWYTYQFPTNSFPDYPKFSVWSDGYYITANKNSGTAGFSQVVYAIERDKMLTGDPTAQMVGFPLPTIKTSGFYSPLGFNCNGSELPPPGNAPIIYMQDDSWSGVSTDHLKIWSINVDWDTPSNSTISTPQIINTTPFDGLFDGGSFSNLPQPSGQDIDALQATIMYMAQYRRFADHNSAVLNFVVDLNGNDNLAGIRWFELRQDNDGSPWDIYQEGTYSQPDGFSAFSGNICMDVDGNIALAYTVVSTSHYPSLRYTGRYSTDPLGIMTIEEESFAEGTQSDPSSRYGDYSQMTIDPLDDKTFWSIGEFFTGGSRKNQVGVFKIASDLANDVGIVSIDSPVNGILSDAESITVSIRNYGVDTQTSIPVSYKINNGEIITEMFNGSISSNTEELFTFATTADLSAPGATYHIFATTGLVSDENFENDSVAIFVTHLYPEDLGVSSVMSPESGTYLSDEETVSVMIENYGVLSQSDFNISYILNNGSPVTEQVTDIFPGQSTGTYTFTTPVNLSAIGNHELKVTTILPGDPNPSNDTMAIIITNNMCQPDLMCTQGVGIYTFQLGEIENETGCNPDGYGNYWELSTHLIQGSSNELTITTGYGDVFVKLWIDFDDDFLFEENEVVVNDFEIADGQSAGSYTETMPMLIPVNAEIGEHLMRTRVNWSEGVPADPCEETVFGETEDYTAIIDDQTGLGFQSIETNELLIFEHGDNHFTARFEANSLKETLVIKVHNIQGQTLLYNRISNIDGVYEFDFDLSYTSPGIYLVSLGSESFGKIKRIVVK